MNVMSLEPRTTFVRTTSKDVGSVLTLCQVNVFCPFDTQPWPLLGDVTWYASTKEIAKGKTTARRVRLNMMKVIEE